MTEGERVGTRVIPTLRYQDATAAIEWLGAAFGFEPHLVVPGEGRNVLHAQLVAGSVMIMLGSVRDDTFGRLQRPPRESGTACTQSPYIIVEEIDAHYARALSAGAEVVVEIADQEHGGRMYSCLDPEGHLWNFGDYDPWASE